MIRLSFKDPQMYEIPGHREALEQVQKLLNDKLNEQMLAFTTFGSCQIELPDSQSLVRMVEEKLSE